MFASVNEGAYDSTSQPWTSDDWAFIPYNFTSVRIPKNESRTNISSQYPPENSVTLQTTSLRGRLECIPINMSNTSAWLTTLNLTDNIDGSRRKGTNNLSLGYEINQNFSGISLTTGGRIPFNMSVASYQMPNFQSNINSSEETAIGYWTTSEDDPHESIIIQWITGYPMLYPLNGSTQHGAQTRWIWREIPKITALKCTPVFEIAEAAVNVDAATNLVENYTITSTPSPDIHAWSSKYQALNVSQGVPYSSSPEIGAGFQAMPGVFLQNVSVRYV